jgi:exodeoxyribonuclease-5
MTELSQAQRAAIEQISKWYENVPTQPFRLFGFAGTGKTTTAKEIPAALGLSHVVYGAYTGKAAHVLRTKGAPATTIHRAIYLPVADAMALAEDEAPAELAEIPEAWRDAEVFTDAVNTPRARVAELEAQLGQLRWEWNPASPWADADLIILDEVSMVDTKLAQDIQAYGVPVLVLGDPAQLPPVEGGGYYINAEPDVLLTEVHRQALDSPVLSLATRIRQSTNWDLGIDPDEMTPASRDHAMEHDQILCWSNRRRWALVEAIRRRLGRLPGDPVPGDRIMCLTNNRDLAVFNGQQFQVLASTPGTLGPTLTVQDIDNGTERQVAVYSDGFQGRELEDMAKRSGAGIRGGRMLATYANVITVHKAQGSEWPSVYVVNEPPGSSASRLSGRAPAQRTRTPAAGCTRPSPGPLSTSR